MRSLVETAVPSPASNCTVVLVRPVTMPSREPSSRTSREPTVSKASAPSKLGSDAMLTGLPLFKTVVFTVSKEVEPAEYPLANASGFATRPEYTMLVAFGVECLVDKLRTVLVLSLVKPVCAIKMGNLSGAVSENPDSLSTIRLNGL